jgi:hypothetical protein
MTYDVREEDVALAKVWFEYRAAAKTVENLALLFSMARNEGHEEGYELRREED